MAPKRAEKATAYYVRVSSKTQDMRSQIPDLETYHANGPAHLHDLVLGGRV